MTSDVDRDKSCNYGLMYIIMCLVFVFKEYSFIRLHLQPTLELTPDPDKTNYSKLLMGSLSAYQLPKLPTS